MKILSAYWHVAGLLIIFFSFSTFSSAQQMIRVPGISPGFAGYLSQTKEIIGWGYLPGTTNKQFYRIDSHSGELTLLAPSFGEDTDQFVGGDLSEDGQFLYIRVDNYLYQLGTNDFSLLDSFPVFEAGATEPFDFSVSPVDPTLIAVWQNNGFANPSDIHLFQNGQKLPLSSAIRWSNGAKINFSKDGEKIFLRPTGSSDESFYTLLHDDGGVTGLDTALFYIDSDIPMKEYQEHLYTRDGHVIDINTDRPFFNARRGVYHHRRNIYESEYDFILFDESQDQIIYLDAFSPVSDERFLFAYYVDSERLTLQKTRSMPIPSEFPFAPFGFSHRTSFNQMESGLNFFIYNINSITIIRDCEVTAPSPVYSPPLPDPIILCYGSEQDEGFEFTPPDGAGFFYDSGGFLHSSSQVAEEGEYSIQTLDENGCLSEPAIFNVIHADFVRQPKLTTPEDVYGISGVETLALCEEGSLRLRATQEEDELSPVVWSTGETTKTITVDQPGAVWVNAISPQGCPSVSEDTVMVFSHSGTTPTPPVITGEDLNMNFCVSSTLTLNVSEEYEQYHWIIGDGEFSTANSWRTIEWPSVPYTTPMNIAVSVKNAADCWSDYTSLFVRRYNSLGVPSRPAIVGNNNFLTTDTEAVEYRWFYNGEEIEDSDRPVMFVSALGEYKLRIRHDACWSDFSLPYILE